MNGVLYLFSDKLITNSKPLKNDSAFKFAFITISKVASVYSNLNIVIFHLISILTQPFGTFKYFKTFRNSS